MTEWPMIGDECSPAPSNPFESVTNWEKYQAFEWLRNIALADAEVGRIASICLVEWNKAMASVHAWKPIADAPVSAFDKEKWLTAHSPRLLLWTPNYFVIGEYGYTEKGKGRWQAYGRTISPTHWMMLPERPA